METIRGFVHILLRIALDLGTFSLVSRVDTVKQHKENQTITDCGGHLFLCPLKHAGSLVLIFSFSSVHRSPSACPSSACPCNPIVCRSAEHASLIQTRVCRVFVYKLLYPLLSLSLYSLLLSFPFSLLFLLQT